MTREQVVQILKSVGLSDDQIEAAFARLQWAEKLPKIARALQKFGGHVTITVKGSYWSAEIDGHRFEGSLSESVGQSAGQVKGKSGDSARKILQELRDRGVTDISDAAIQYAAAYIQRVKRLQEAIRQHPDLHERAVKLGLMD
jgi:SOS response regulatory protein OraA/RecX